MNRQYKKRGTYILDGFGFFPYNIICGSSRKQLLKSQDMTLLLDELAASLLVVLPYPVQLPT
jgi:hypothetical protein